MNITRFHSWVKPKPKKADATRALTELIKSNCSSLGAIQTLVDYFSPARPAPAKNKVRWLWQFIATVTDDDSDCIMILEDKLITTDGKLFAVSDNTTGLDTGRYVPSARDALLFAGNLHTVVSLPEFDKFEPVTKETRLGPIVLSTLSTVGNFKYSVMIDDEEYLFSVLDAYKVDPYEVKITKFHRESHSVCLEGQFGELYTGGVSW